MTNTMLELQVRTQTATHALMERLSTAMERARDEEGQTSVEYLGIVVVVVMIVGVLMAANHTIGDKIVTGITDQIAKLK